MGNRVSSSAAAPDAQQEPSDLTTLDHFLNEDDELDAQADGVTESVVDSEATL